MADMVFSLELIAKLIEIRTTDVKIKSEADNVVNFLVANGLIAPSDETWSVTEKGIIYCRWLCEVPMPVHLWSDPRKDKK